MAHSMKKVVFTVGLPCAGKSTLVEEYIAEGFINLNRDELGGSLKSLHEKLDEQLELYDKFIIDNTYVDKRSRAEIIKIANSHNAFIQVVWVKTSIEDCQFNAVYRTLNKGREVPATALFAAKKTFEEPELSEGIDAILNYPFVRKLPKKFKNKALILDYDGTVRKTKSGAKYPLDKNDIEILPGIIEKIKAYKDKGYIILGASNQSAVGKGLITKEKMDKLFEHTNKLLGLDIDVLYCPDASFPIKSYDRKPLPGMGVKHIMKYNLNPKETIMVGDATSDETFAKRCGFKFIHIDHFK